MANGTSTSHARLTVAEILESPGRHEAYLAEVAAWADDLIGIPAPETGRPGTPDRYGRAAMRRDTVTITGYTEPAPTRRQVTDALLDEADWLAEHGTARATERTRIAHVLVFTGLGQEIAVLSEVRSEVRPRLLRQGIVVGEFHRAGTSTDVRNGNYATGPSPWPGFGLAFKSSPAPLLA